MGGAVRVPGNVTPVAEFNICYDPESADEVFTTAHQTVLLPLDVTSKLIFTRYEMRTILANMKGKRAKFLEALTLYTFKTNMAFRETAGAEGFLVHDASVIAMLIYPHLLTGQFLPIRVESKGEFTRGQTVTDLRNVAQPSTHTFVVTDVDRDRFMESMVQDFLGFL
jgi:inosine-uridine nucleoside N-ribohydrolase